MALLALLGLAGCGRVPPVAVEALPAAADGARVPYGPGRGVVEIYRTQDGQELAYIAYRSAEIPADTAIVQLPGMAGHAGWFAQPAARLRDLGYHVFSLDRRGAGINRENRTLASGDAENAEILLADIHAFVQPLREHYPRIVLIGTGWGGKLALAYALAQPEQVDALVLVAPELVPAGPPDETVEARLKLARLFHPKAPIEVPLAPELISATPASRELIRTDPLRLQQVTADFLLASQTLDERIAAAADERRVPALLVLAGRDRIADNAASRRLLAAAPAPLETITYADQLHTVELDEPGLLVGDIDRWLEAGRTPPLEMTAQNR